MCRAAVARASPSTSTSSRSDAPPSTVHALFVLSPLSLLPSLLVVHPLCLCLCVCCCVCAEIDAQKAIRRSHDNVMVKELYASYLGKPLGEKAHHILHTHYTDRTGTVCVSVLFCSFCCVCEFDCRCVVFCCMCTYRRGPHRHPEPPWPHPDGTAKGCRVNVNMNDRM